MNEETEKKDEPGAKEISLASMIIGAVWIGLLSLVKAFFHLISDKAFGLTMNEILVSGLTIAAIFTPVYLAIIMDKVKALKIAA